MSVAGSHPPDSWEAFPLLQGLVPLPAVLSLLHWIPQRFLLINNPSLLSCANVVCFCYFTVSWIISKGCGRGAVKHGSSGRRRETEPVAAAFTVECAYRKIHPFQVYNSVTSGEFTELWDCHDDPVLELLRHLRRIPCARLQSGRLPPPPTNH